MKYDELKHIKKEYKKNGLLMLYRLSCVNNIKLNNMCEYVYLNEMSDYLINLELNFLKEYLRTSKLLNIETNEVKYKIELLTNLKLYQRKLKIEKIKRKIQH